MAEEVRPLDISLTLLRFGWLANLGSASNVRKQLRLGKVSGRD
jgi:hypothetical protein